METIRIHLLCRHRNLRWREILNLNHYPLDVLPVDVVNCYIAGV